MARCNTPDGNDNEPAAAMKNLDFAFASTEMLAASTEFTAVQDGRIRFGGGPNLASLSQLCGLRTPILLMRHIRLLGRRGITRISRARSIC
jgi:hypothetical protein